MSTTAGTGINRCRPASPDGRSTSSMTQPATSHAACLSWEGGRSLMKHRAHGAFLHVLLSAVVQQRFKHSGDIPLRAIRELPAADLHGLMEMWAEIKVIERRLDRNLPALDFEKPHQNRQDIEDRLCGQRHEARGPLLLACPCRANERPPALLDCIG